jgi:hypothetical protein
MTKKVTPAAKPAAPAPAAPGGVQGIKSNVDVNTLQKFNGIVDVTPKIKPQIKDAKGRTWTKLAGGWTQDGSTRTIDRQDSTYQSFDDAWRVANGAQPGNVGVPGAQQPVAEGDVDSPVASAITRRILMQRSDLLSKYGPEKVTAAIDEVADFVGDVEEIGSSDVSGWIKQIEQSLGNTAEEVAVTTGNPPLEETFEDELNDLKRLLGEGWKSELAGGTLGGVAGTAAGSALGALATGSPIGAAIGGVVGGAAGGTGGAMLGREMSKEEQLNEIAPLLAAGARAVIPLLAKVGPKLGQMASGAGKAGAQVAGKTAAGIGRGTADVAKSAAQSAAQNAGQIGLGVGAYQAITDVADKMVGGVGEVYRDVGQAAGAIAQAVGDAIDGKTLAELAGAAVKYAIPVGILLAVLYGGKKLIDQVMAEGLPGALGGQGLGAIAGAALGGPAGVPVGAAIGAGVGSLVNDSVSSTQLKQVKETTALQGQYGHSGKLQKFDDVEEDVLHRLRQLSGMIRS